MPTAYVEKIAKEKNLKVNDVEKKWDEAKGIISKQYPNINQEDSKFYALTMSVFKKMINVNEDASMAATTTSNVGGTTDGVANSNSYVYKKKTLPTMSRISKNKKKPKNLKEYIEIWND